MTTSLISHRSLPNRFALKLVALVVVGGLAASANAQSNEAKLMGRLDQLAAELEKVKIELKAM